MKNNWHNLSTLTLNYAWRSNANCSAVFPRFGISFLKALCIISNGQFKNSNSPLNPFSFKFSSDFLKITLLIWGPSVEILYSRDQGIERHPSSSSFNNISVISTAFVLVKWIEVKYFVTTWFSSLFQNLRRMSICFLFWWVVVLSNIIVKVPLYFLIFVTSHCGSNGPKSIPQNIWCLLDTHSKWFYHI